MTTPVATTFYSHRIFLSYQPDDYRNYLSHIVDQSKWNKKSEAERFQLESGLFAWGTILVYRARMVPFHFNRELKRLVDEGGKFIEPDASTPLTRGIFRQQLAMQLGIEAIMRREKVKERIAEVPAFQQYTYDTLYWPSYQHEKGLNDGVDPNSKDEEDKKDKSSKDEGDKKEKGSKDGGHKKEKGSKDDGDKKDSAKEGEDEKGYEKEKQERPFVCTLDSLKEYLWFRAKGSRRLRDESFPPNDIAVVLFRALEEYLELLANPLSIQRETMTFARQLPDERKQRLWISLADASETRPFVTRTVSGPEP